MIQRTFKAVLEALSTRNAALIAVYKESAKNLLSRPAMSLILSMADQRREFGKELSSLALSPGIGAEPLELEIRALPDLAPPRSPPGDVAELLKLAQKAESEDYELMTAVSGVVLPISPGIAERLAGLAEQARKRSSWAQDHLDLLGI